MIPTPWRRHTLTSLAKRYLASPPLSLTPTELSSLVSFLPTLKTSLATDLLPALRREDLSQEDHLSLARTALTLPPWAALDHFFDPSLPLAPSLQALSENPTALPELAGFPPSRVLSALRSTRCGECYYPATLLALASSLDDPTWELLLCLLLDEPYSRQPFPDHVRSKILLAQALSALPPTSSPTSLRGTLSP